MQLKIRQYIDINIPLKEAAANLRGLSLPSAISRFLIPYFRQNLRILLHSLSFHQVKILNNKYTVRAERRNFLNINFGFTQFSIFVCSLCQIAKAVSFCNNQPRNQIWLMKFRKMKFRPDFIFIIYSMIYVYHLCIFTTFK